jgi:hypothetical protein
VSLLADLAQPTKFTLKITGPYQFPAAASQSVTLYFDKGFQVLAGTADGNSISIILNASSFPQFLHGFTAGQTMLIAEGANPPFTMSLAGTSSAISALGKCTVAADFTQLPPPWHAAPGQIQGPGSPQVDPTLSALTSCRSQTDSLLRLRCYDAISLQAPTASSTPQETTQSSAASASNPNSVNQPSAPIAAVPSQTTSPDTPATNNSPTSTPTSEQDNENCKDDWRKCKDNSDLVNNYSDWVSVQVACQYEVNKEVKYGAPKWPGFWSGGSFGNFLPGTDYISTGIAVAIEPDVQIENEYGAMVHSTAYCRYDLNAKAVVDVSVDPN